ncbi:hypothetical protein RB536_09930 [Escherichia coli]|nr:hypothetical protein RB536_09930 [Escherichia coli]
METISLMGEIEMGVLSDIYACAQASSGEKRRRNDVVFFHNMIRCRILLTEPGTNNEQ